MKEKLMSKIEIEEEIEFEDSCGVNTLLQNLIFFKDKINVFKLINKKKENCGYVIRNKNTNEVYQL